MGGELIKFMYEFQHFFFEQTESSSLSSRSTTSVVKVLKWVISQEGG